MRRIIGKYGFAMASEEANAYGEQQPVLRLDLREVDPRVMETIHFLTVVPHESSAAPGPDVPARGAGSFLGIRDAREDRYIIEGPPVTRFVPAWERIPVRGPIQVEIGGITRCTGYVEDEGPDVEYVLRPLSLTDVEIDYLPLVLTAEEADRPFGDVPEGIWNVSICAHVPDENDSVDLKYVPRDAKEPVATITVQGGERRFLQVLERIPVRGPGRIVVDAHLTVGAATLYGTLGA